MLAKSVFHIFRESFIFHPDQQFIYFFFIFFLGNWFILSVIAGNVLAVSFLLLLLVSINCANAERQIIANMPCFYLRDHGNFASENRWNYRLLSTACIEIMVCFVCLVGFQFDWIMTH